MSYSQFLVYIATKQGYFTAKGILCNLWKQGNPTSKRTLWAVYKWAVSNNLLTVQIDKGVQNE